MPDDEKLEEVTRPNIYSTSQTFPATALSDW
jgi:hypothetical protein